MKKNVFLNKTYCELIIIPYDIDPEIITNELNIIPEREFRKGEQIISKNSGSIITKPSNLWAIKSKPLVIDEETISHHIAYFKNLLEQKIETLKKYKEDPHFDITFWVWIETENAGIGFDLNEIELTFISQITNRIHFSLISKNENKI